MAFALPALPYVMAGTAALSGIAQMQNAQYQSAIATQNANLLAETAIRENQAANQDMQDRDIDARAEIANLMAEMDASGLTSTSGSMLARRQGAQSLADRDRERLAEKRDVQFKNTKQQEASMRAEAAAAKRAGRLGLVTSLLSIPTSFLSGATMVNQYNAGRLSLTNPSIVR